MFITSNFNRDCLRAGLILAICLCALPALHSQIITVTTGLDTVDNGDGVISLREAISTANSQSGENTIEFHASLNGDTIVLNNGSSREDFNVDGDLDLRDGSGIIISGNGIGNTIIDGNGTERIFDHINGDLTIENLTIQNGYDDAVNFAEGGCIRSIVSSAREITISNCLIQDCFIEAGTGGGIHISTSSSFEHEVLISDVTFDNCTSDGGFLVDGGGALYADVNNLLLEIDDCVFNENDSDTDGGAIVIESNGGKVTISYSSFTASETAIANSNGKGGALLFTGSLDSIIIHDCDILQNTFATNGGTGGGIHLDNSNTVVSITQSNISSNEATSTGGGIFVGGSNQEVFIIECTIDSNEATHGGGINIQGSSNEVNILKSSIIYNEVSEDGGGIHSNSDAIISVANSTFSGNKANRNGGALSVSNSENVSLNFTTITNNIANDNNNGTGDGGGIYMSGSNTPSVDIQNSIVQGNDEKGASSTDDCGDNSTDGNLTSTGGNVFGSGTGCPVGAGDTTGSANLEPLQDNGGQTLTHRVPDSSAARNFSPCGVVTEDQRGVARVDGSCDAGAYEESSLKCFLVTNSGNAGLGTLRAAIDSANAHVFPMPDTIKFAAIGKDGFTHILLTTNLQDITDPVFIDGLSETGTSHDSWPPQLKVVLDGSSSGGGGVGLTFEAGSGGSTVRGLVIRDNWSVGILLIDSDSHSIQCNFIGTDRTGMVAAPNDYGVAMVNSSYNKIGGSELSSRNLISSNYDAGVFLTNGSHNNQVAGNFIGVNVQGGITFESEGIGIFLDGLCHGNNIGGSNSSERNIISGNKGGGVILLDNCRNNKIVGNFIGPDSSGTATVDTQFYGIYLKDGCDSTQIGGPSIGEGNLISGNTNFGIGAQNIMDIHSQFKVQGNRIFGNGLNYKSGGMVNLLAAGIIVVEVSGLIVGGDSEDSGNTVSGNGGPGLYIIVSDSVLIKNNGVGFDLTNSTENGNQSSGIVIVGSDLVTLSQNRITGNGQLGIDLVDAYGEGFVSTNDYQDLDPLNLDPSNQGQNFPILVSAVSNESDSLVVSGSFNSFTDVSGFVLEFFSNVECDSSGFGEGKQFLGSGMVTTDSIGNASFNVYFNLNQPVGEYITATATSPEGRTSEFSSCVQVTDTLLEFSNCFIVTNTKDGGEGSLRRALDLANSIKNISDTIPDTIKFNISGIAPHTIQPMAELPFIIDQVVIDGGTNPDALTAQWPPTLTVEVDGINLSENDEGAGFIFTGPGSGSLIKGLVINRFDRSHIRVMDVSDICIQGNFIGTDVDGLIGLGDQDGIRFSNAHRIQIGGLEENQRNLIGGCESGEGIDIDAQSSYNLVINNYIGVNKNGTGSVANGNGIEIDGGSSHNIIGGTSELHRNIISGNEDQGVKIYEADSNLIIGNYIGTSANGQTALPNEMNGVRISYMANGNRIGDESGNGNIISGNLEDGIRVYEESSNTSIYGNVIGLAADLRTPMGNKQSGISVYDEIDSIIIGNETELGGNLIAYNDSSGILVALASSAQIAGNSIWNNGLLGIDLSLNSDNPPFADGVSPNDSLEQNIGPNFFQNYPVLTAVTSLGDSIKVEGIFHSTQSANGFVLRFYANCTCNGDTEGNPQTEDFGEGELFIGSIIVDTDSAGDATFSTQFPLAVSDSLWITSTATDTSGNYSSEFSRCKGVFGTEGGDLEWTGQINSDWTNKLNWNPTRIPVITDKVAIHPAPYDAIIHAGILGQAKSITINSQGFLTVLSQGKLTVGPSDEPPFTTIGSAQLFVELGGILDVIP